MKTGKIIKKFKLGNREVVFRYPKFEDAEQLLKWINSFVDEKAYLAIQKKIKMKNELDFLTNTLKDIEANKKISIVVEFDGKVVGMTDVIKFTNDFRKHIGTMGIAFAKEARGTGVAELAVKALFKEAKNNLKIKLIKLTLVSQNKRAFNFYKKVGFKYIGIIKKGIYHYGKLLDETIMVKYL